MSRVKSITSYPISPEDVASYFAVHFGEHANKAQFLLQEWMQRLCPGYDAKGVWAAFELSNGGFYVVPKSREHYAMESPNGYSAILSAEAAGIVVSMFAINYVANETEVDYLSDAYHALRHFGAEHKEAQGIFALTD